jgi:tight adherence protein B
MTVLTGLYLALAVTGTAAALTPVLRARRRWRRLLRDRATSLPSTRRRVAPLRTLLGAAGAWSVAAAGGGAGVAAALLAGPVAGAVAAAYGAAAIVIARRRARRRTEGRSRSAAVDAVAALAAELRAGVAVGPALATVRADLDGSGIVGAGAGAVAARLEAAVELAETSGAPLADVLDRLDTHLRAGERARATAEAQAAGALASAGLLAVMPVAGVGLGALVGISPTHVLLHTPIGAACLCAAVALQLVGLAWSARLSRVRVVA